MADFMSVGSDERGFRLLTPAISYAHVRVYSKIQTSMSLKLRTGF